MVTHVVTLANSIVGVSVLAMPFCFKFCGVFLATCMLMLSAVMTRIVCYFLLKAGIMTKRRSYEMLAFHTFGQAGKFMVEVTIIGFLMGTLIAFLVVIGDLGPQIVAEIFSIENNDSLRTVVMTGLALFVALPLGLLRDIDSLGSVSTISFLFYFFLVLKILNEGVGSLGTERLESLNYWRLSGALQCIPIFAMALSCQTQIFSIYDSLPDPSVQKMNEVVKKAVYLCTCFYFCVGFFGYVAFSNEGITGNILMSFGPTWTTQLIKACFVLSIAFSVPLCIFPCRASLHSLFFKGAHAHAHHSIHDMSTNYIPDGKLRLLTVLIVGTTLIIALLIPNIELVLGLVGSTAGSVICLIFPSAMFIRVTPKKTTERLLAQFILATGICIMFLTTYATLYAVEQAQATSPKMIDTIMLDKEVLLGPIKTQEAINAVPPLPPKEDDLVKFEPKQPLLIPSRDFILPVEQKKDPVLEIQKPVAVEMQPSPVPQLMPPADVVKKEEPPPVKVEEPIESKREAEKYKQEVPIVPPVVDEARPPAVPLEVKPAPPEAPQPPVVKEEPKPKEDLEEKTKDFLKKLEEHQAEQKDLIQKQKEILAQLEEHHKEDMKVHDAHHQPDGEGHIEKQKEVLSNLRKTAAGEVHNAVMMDALQDGLKKVVNDEAVKESHNPSPPKVEPKVMDAVPGVVPGAVKGAEAPVPPHAVEEVQDQLRILPPVPANSPSPVTKDKKEKGDHEMK